ncbi:interferon regulatory factor 3 [Eucyclogobius newberryi]|uniref:interferon regulatory factor 3 n=1 Tax=Eucyclogobius newberryi TaxID=166745 RepID=UPI003B5CA9AE
MAHPRPLLMPWLHAQISSQQYPGVAWTNAERTEFSVPWKHALRHDSSSTDILLFKAWAEVSGNGRANGDPSVWKRNFRSALRAKGFIMVSDCKNDAANPHKIFRWPDETGSKKNPCLSPDQPSPDLFEGLPLPTQESQPHLLSEQVYLGEDLFTEPAGDHDILQECLKGLNIGPEAEGFEPPPEQQRLVEADVIGAHELRGQQQYPVSAEAAVHGAGLPGQPGQPMEGAVGGAYDQERAEQFLHTITKTDDGSNFKTDFKIKAYYRGKLVLDQLIQNESGLRIVHRPHLVDCGVDPESGLSLVSLPSLLNMTDQTQANLTQRILDSLGWLDVGVSGHVVYGQRHGEIKAFWSFSDFDQSRQPQEVTKEPQALYMFKDFMKGMVDFIYGKESPPCTLFFCLGEKWPDPDNKPWSKKLIIVEVVLTSMEILKNMAVEGGASSLQSVELQMSLEEMMELY